MNNLNVFRLAACAALLALAGASSLATAAATEGSACAVHSAATQGMTAPIGHVDATGKCVTKAAPKAKEDDGLQASAQCRDLSFSYSKKREAACTKHGGVLEWLAAQ